MSKPAKFRLKKVLKEKDVSQYELAKRLGVHTNNVSRMVKPGYNPTLKTLNKLADALGCKVTDFIEEPAE